FFSYLTFFFILTSTTEIYTLSLHDALPISGRREEEKDEGGDQRHHVRVDDRLDASRVAGRDRRHRGPAGSQFLLDALEDHDVRVDRKSTRLNSSHVAISYAVFCLKKKKNKQ